MTDQDSASRWWDATEPLSFERVSDARRNDYFYQHRPYEHFVRSLVLLRLLTDRGKELSDVAQGLDESWMLSEITSAQTGDIAGGTDLDIPYVILQTLAVKFQAIETLLRHFLAHRDSPSEPWSHIGQLRVPRHFSEQVRQLLEVGHAERVPLVEQIFFGITAATRSHVPWPFHEWAQQISGVDAFLEMCLRCWLEEQGPFLAAKHGYVAMPYEINSLRPEENMPSERPRSTWAFRYVAHGDTTGWQFETARSDEPNVVACEIYFASRLLRQLLDVGRIRNVPSEARTIDVIWWDAELCERVRNGTLDIADGPPPTRPWSVPQ